MQIVNINNLRKKYDIFLKKYSKYRNIKILKFNYLNLSIFFSRDDREFDINNYMLLKELFNKNQISKYKISKKNKSVSGYHKYLFNFKESKYLPNKKFPLILFIDLLKHIKQFLDICLIFNIIFISSILKVLPLLNKKPLKLKHNKVYGITYWVKKKVNSATYYYPGIEKVNNNKVFVTSFADVKLFSYGLINALFNSNFITPVHILNLNDLIISTLQVSHLYLYDIYLIFFKKKLSFLSFWTGWKKGAEFFYSILIYNSLIKISRNSLKCEFITWYENHITNRSFALAVSYSKKKFSTNCKLSTFNGTPFNQNVPKHILPIKLEHELGLFGDNYYVQDTDSREELKYYLEKEKINISVNVVPVSMLRAKFLIQNKTSINESRSITIFTHASYWDLIACLLSIFNKKNKCNKKQREIVEKEKIITIRLHPALNEIDALKEIKSIKEIPLFINYKFIKNNQESFIRSITLSKYCFFGISSYVNLAIENNAQVFSVQTSHINKAPIKSNLIKSPNLKVVSPW